MLFLNGGGYISFIWIKKIVCMILFDQVYNLLLLHFQVELMILLLELSNLLLNICLVLSLVQLEM